MIKVWGGSKNFDKNIKAVRNGNELLALLGLICVLPYPDSETSHKNDHFRQICDGLGNYLPMAQYSSAIRSASLV